jgi:hypothetical protein
MEPAGQGLYRRQFAERPEQLLKTSATNRFGVANITDRAWNTTLTY